MLIIFGLLFMLIFMLIFILSFMVILSGPINTMSTIAYFSNQSIYLSFDANLPQIIKVIMCHLKLTIINHIISTYACRIRYDKY